MTTNLKFDWKLPAERVGQPPSNDLLQRRGQSFPPTDLHPAIAVEQVTVAGVPSSRVGGGKAPLRIVYFHGGGYRMGHPSSWLEFAKELSARTGADVLLPDYRLAPEHPFPAALRDAAAIYEQLIQEDVGLIIGGDSAGGGLAMSLMAAALSSGVPSPLGVFGISPWLDLTVRAGTFETRAATDRLFSAESAHAAADAYTQGIAFDEPLVSPLFATVEGFPPTLLTVGTAEVLLDDSLSFAQHLARAGVSVDLHVSAGMPHIWPVLLAGTVDAERALAVLASFVSGISSQSEG